MINISKNIFCREKYWKEHHNKCCLTAGLLPYGEPSIDRQLKAADFEPTKVSQYRYTKNNIQQYLQYHHTSLKWFVFNIFYQCGQMH